MKAQSVTAKRKVLVVEDERIVAEDLRELLEELGHEVVGLASDGEKAIALAHKHLPDVVCMDIVIRGDMDGIETAGRIQEELGISSIFMSAYSDRTIVDRAKETRPAGYLVKPYDSTMLRCTLEVAFSRIDVDRELVAQTRSLETLVEQRAQEFKQVQRQLFESQKMEAVGNLTGGIAHDFNNMLLPIMGYSNMLVESLQDQPELAKMASEIHQAANSSSALTRQLLAFSRRQILAKKVVDINEVLVSSERMLTRLIGEHVSLRLDLADGGIHGVMDAGQIEQVLMNLCINARDSMPGGGVITVTTELLSEHDERVRAGVREDLDCGWMHISVADTGSGMPDEVRERIFEPFFSTKGNDGTGLGLSVVHGIIIQHDGHLEVESQAGVGTTFHIYLPVEEVEEKDEPEKDEPERNEPERNEEKARAVGGNEKILVIEDEPQVRIFVARA
ncbi:MAG: signal transduction histidine kinase, partial [Verrucomicrobiales bacterium]